MVPRVPVVSTKFAVPGLVNSKLVTTRKETRTNMKHFPAKRILTLPALSVEIEVIKDNYRKIGLLRY